MCNICHGLGCPCCEPEIPPCPRCNGNGEHYYRYDADTDTLTPVTRRHYQTLPSDEQYIEQCEYCNGSGEEQEDPAQARWDSQTYEAYLSHG